MSTLQDLEGEDANGNEGLLMDLSGSAQNNAEIRQNLEEFAIRNKDDVVYWVEKSGRGDDVTLYGAPLHVGELLEELLYTRKSSVVMTSATLAANGTFDHIQERTGFVDSEQRLLGSPFDFPNSALVCVPKRHAGAIGSQLHGVCRSGHRGHCDRGGRADNGAVHLLRLAQRCGGGVTRTHEVAGDRYPCAGERRESRTRSSGDFERIQSR